MYLNLTKKILLIEDDTCHANLIMLRLKKMGYTDVTHTNNGYEGLKLAKEIKPDLIILDVLLPKMNGYTVCRLLKFDEKYKGIPIIMLTSREAKSHEQLGRKAGANEYVFKSDRTGSLLKLIRKYLELN